MKIEVGKTYLSRDGRKCRILAVDLKNEQPVVGAFETGSDLEDVEIFCENGRYLTDRTSNADLVSVWSPWCNVKVDAKVRVRDDETLSWVNRHFAKFNTETGKIETWEWGTTSFTNKEKNTASWKYAELVD